MGRLTININRNKKQNFKEFCAWLGYEEFIVETVVSTMYLSNFESALSFFLEVESIECIEVLEKIYKSYGGFDECYNEFKKQKL